MRTRGAWAAALIVAAAAGCSAPPPVEPEPGTLVLGTAQVVVDDVDGGTTDAVACSIAGPFTTITTGDATAGVRALVSNADGLSAKWVSINSLAGFTGSFQADLQGDARVTRTGRTYDISGTADGFRADRPSMRTTSTFTVKVAC